MIRRFCDLVLVGDFLDPADEIMAWLDALARRGVRGHLIEVADPAEETFPYAGRTEFTDPETGEKLTAGRAEIARATTIAAPISPAATSLGEPVRRLGWSFTPSTTPTGSPPRRWSRVHMYLSGMPARYAVEASYELACRSPSAYPAILWRPARAAGDLVAAAADAAEAADRSLPAAADPGPRAEARGDAARRARGG